jgi:hypothetical protein
MRESGGVVGEEGFEGLEGEFERGSGVEGLETGGELVWQGNRECAGREGLSEGGVGGEDKVDVSFGRGGGIRWFGSRRRSVYHGHDEGGKVGRVDICYAGLSRWTC